MVDLTSLGLFEIEVRQANIDHLETFLCLVMSSNKSNILPHDKKHEMTS